MREYWQIQKSGGKNKSERLLTAAKTYLQIAYDLEEKVMCSIQKLRAAHIPLQGRKQEQLDYFHTMLIRHIDLIERRLINGETIPQQDKCVSLFEPYTQWINKGKTRPSVELGRKVLITTDQFGLILYSKVMDQTVDQRETIPMIDILLRQYGERSFDSISFDKGFSSDEDRALIALFIPTVVMPKKGRLTINDKERESTKKFKRLRKKHSAIESNINALEHHGLNRCPDKGFPAFKRYASLGVLAYNCHKIGAQLLKKQALLLLKKAA
jgi:IS5 family transposase